MKGRNKVGAEIVTRQVLVINDVALVDKKIILSMVLIILVNRTPYWNYDDFNDDSDQEFDDEDGQVDGQ